MHCLVLNSKFRPRNVVTYVFRVIFTVHSFPSQYSVHRLVFPVENSVLYEVRTKVLYILYINFILKGCFTSMNRRALTTEDRLRSQAGQSEICVG